MSSKAGSSKDKDKTASTNDLSRAINSSGNFLSDSLSKPVPVPGNTKRRPRSSTAGPTSTFGCSMEDMDLSKWIKMPKDSESTAAMIGKCLLTGNKRTPQFMYKSSIIKRCLFQTTVMLLGDSGVGKSSVINQLLNTNFIKTSPYQSATRSVMEYSAVTAIQEIRTRGVKLGIVDTPGFNDTDGLEQDACNLFAIKKYCGQNCCLMRSCFPNVIILCVTVNDNRYEGSSSNLAKSLRILKDLGVIDSDRCNLIVVITHACSLGFSNVQRWNERLQQKSEDFQRILKEWVGFEPLVIYTENSPEDYDLELVNGGSVLPDGTVQPSNLFAAIMKLLEDNQDELGYVTIREFYRRSARGVNFSVNLNRSVKSKVARCNELNEEEKACAEYLLRSRSKWELAKSTFSREREEISQREQDDAISIEEQFNELERKMRVGSVDSDYELVWPQAQIMTSSSFSNTMSFMQSVDSRKSEAESKELLPEDKNINFKTMIIFFFSLVGIVLLKIPSILGPIFSGPGWTSGNI